MANGTLKVSNIETSSGSGTITLGQSGETVDMANGTITLNSSMKMTPAFEAYLSSAQSVSDATETKVQCDTEVFDSDSCYDNSTNYRFTPTVAGKYFVYVNLLGKASGDNLLASPIATIKKNGSEYAAANTQFYTNYEKQHTIAVSHIIDMNGSSDYLEFFGYVNITSGSATFSVDSPKANVFGAYRIIGA
jgi:hypothetical protein